MTDTETLKVLQENYDKLVEEFEQYKKESIKWSIEDFIELEDDYDITPEQAQDALEDMIHHHDASIGINWITIGIYKEIHGTEKHIYEKDPEKGVFGENQCNNSYL